MFIFNSDTTTIQAKNTQGTDTHLHGLRKYTNYTLQVLAYTNGGEGVKSAPTHCLTDQDSELSLILQYCKCIIFKKIHL